MATPAQIRVPGLQKLDVMEMSDAFPPGAVTFADETLPGGKHGELATTAVVVVSALAVKALATWLMKNRTTNRIRKTVEIVDASGTTRKETIDVDLSSSAAPDADVLKALGKILHLDLAKLLDESP